MSLNFWCQLCPAERDWVCPWCTCRVLVDPNPPLAALPAAPAAPFPAPPSIPGLGTTLSTKLGVSWCFTEAPGWGPHPPHAAQDADCPIFPSSCPELYPGPFPSSFHWESESFTPWSPACLKPDVILPIFLMSTGFVLTRILGFSKSTWNEAPPLPHPFPWISLTCKARVQLPPHPALC